MTAEPAMVPARKPGFGHILVFVALLVAIAWALGALAAWPWRASEAGGARLRVSLRHVTAFAGAVERRSAEELARLPAHMRPLDAGQPATARRSDARLTVAIDGRTVAERRFRPTGLRRDGPIYGYEEMPVAPGRHVLTVTLAEVEASGRAWTISRTLDIAEGTAPLLEYQPGRGWVP